MQKSIEKEADNLDDAFLVHTHNFILDEVEGYIVPLQNKVIGQNHVQNSNYKYKAWYKADKELHIGYEVTPKTNKGDYIIEKTGDITVYAGEQVVMKPGFHAESGSTFHAFIRIPPCSASGMSQNSGNNDRKADENYAIRFVENNIKEVEKSEDQKVKLYPNPNNGSFTIEVTDIYLDGEFLIFDTYGKKLYFETIKRNVTQINRRLESGVYYVTLIKGNNKHVEKIIVQ